MNRLYYLIIIVLVVIGLYFLLFREKSRRWSQEWEEGYESFQPTSKIMDLIGIEENMYVGEIGAGNGRFAVRVAKKIGDSGKIYANDIDLKAVRFMTRRCERENITNLQVILSRSTYPNFPRNQLDLVYIINTYEHFTDPVRLLSNTGYSLKQGGKLAIIASDAERANQKNKQIASRESIIENVSNAGYKLVSMDTTSLLYDNIFIFKKREPAN